MTDRVEQLKKELRAARRALAVYAKRGTFRTALHESGYVTDLPQPWRTAAAALGLDNGYPPSELEVLARLTELERELDHG